MSRGKFITVEGLDGAGKTTHLQWLVAALDARRISVRQTREPGGTALGERLREMLLNATEPLHAETETLLMFAARREHIERVIEPALAAGEWVLCDRFTDASFAYQASASGVAWEKIETLERWTHGGLHPDLTLYFDVSPEVAKARGERVKTPDRFEREAAAYHERVRAGYLRRVREQPGRVRLIDATVSLETVQQALEKIVDALVLTQTEHTT